MHLGKKRIFTSLFTQYSDNIKSMIILFVLYVEILSHQLKQWRLILLTYVYSYQGSVKSLRKMVVKLRSMFQCNLYEWNNLFQNNSYRDRNSALRKCYFLYIMSHWRNQIFHFRQEKWKYTDKLPMLKWTCIRHLGRLITFNALNVLSLNILSSCLREYEIRKHAQCPCIRIICHINKLFIFSNKSSHYEPRFIR